jgi:microcystin-dependent protein
MAEPFLGMIALFPYNFAPRGWAFCQGQILSIAQNTALFSLLGTTFGGDGVQTFALPDLRGRAPISEGQGPGLSSYVLGQEGGVESVTLVSSQMPAHTHVISLSNVTAVTHVKNGAGNSRTPVANVPALEAAGVTALYSNSTPDATMADGTVTLSGTPQASVVGSNVPVNIRTPFLVMNYCIATEGIFPSRN